MTSEWNNSNDRESFSSVALYYSQQKTEEIWQPRKTDEDGGGSMEMQCNISASDLTSLDSWAQTPELTRSSVGSTETLDSAALSSQNTTPGDSPASTPTTRRKLRPALKLNLDNVTWTSSSKRHHRRRLRHNLQAGSAKVLAVVQHGKRPEFRFRFLLLTLFAVIVTIVTFTWHMYQRQLQQLAIGDKIRFHEGRRVLHLLRDDGRELVEGILGIYIPPELVPYHCGLLYPLDGPNMCEEWKYRARLHISYSHDDNLSCYSISWTSLMPNSTLRDCISLRKAHWYGMGQLPNLTWPLSPTGKEVRAFVTGGLYGQDFGGILERYWISTDGVAVRVDPDIPLYISLTSDHLCFEAKYDGFPYNAPPDSLPQLRYTICTGTDARSVHEAMVLRFHTLPQNNALNREFLQSTVWLTKPGVPLTQDSVQQFANEIMEHASQHRFLLLDSRWQHQDGSLEFHRKSFPTPREILVILRNKGFKVLLTVHPYVCLFSGAFQNATIEGHFVSDGIRNVPLLMQWIDKVCAVIDLTNQSTAKWFLSRLQKVKEKYGIDGFVFIGGQSSFLPYSYTFHTPTVNPDNFLPEYLSIAAKSSSILGTTVGFMTQHIPAFVRLAPRTSTWDPTTGLQSIIPAVLTLGILGYPLVNIGTVGGDILKENETLPNRELYLRWLQVAVFMPVVQTSVPPFMFDLEVLKAASSLFNVREKRVLPVMEKAFQEHYTNGTPIIRPLWWLAPKDSNAQVVDSQFVIGDEIIVAPILQESKLFRDVYLPPGWWKDELLGEIRRGGKWLHNYPVPVYKVAYFIKTKEPM